MIKNIVSVKPRNRANEAEDGAKEKESKEYRKKIKVLKDIGRGLESLSASVRVQVSEIDREKERREKERKETFP